MSAPKKNVDPNDRASFDPKIIGAIAGVAAFTVVFALLPGLGGIVLGGAAGLLTFFALKSIMSPNPQLGGKDVSSVKDGEKIMSRIKEARAFHDTMLRYEAQIDDKAIKREIGELSSDLQKLIDYVVANPGKWDRLTHWMNTYAAQAEQILANYKQINSFENAESKAKYREDMITALDYLEGSLQGELKSAMSNSAMIIENGADAIKRLASMDGYTVDQRASTVNNESTTDRGESAPGSSILRSI